MRASYYDDGLDDDGNPRPLRLAAVEYDVEISRRMWLDVVWPEEGA